MCLSHLNHSETRAWADCILTGVQLLVALVEPDTVRQDSRICWSIRPCLDRLRHLRLQNSIQPFYVVH